MEFETRISSTFIMNMFMIIMAFIMSVFSFFYPYFRYPIFHYSYTLWIMIGLTRITVYWKYIPFAVGRKTVLIVNENFIYDLADNIVFKWPDISSVYEENKCLYIKLNDPNDYLLSIGNPFKRFLKGISGEPFKINIDMVKVNPDVLLDILDDYSSQAEALEQKK